MQAAWKTNELLDTMDEATKARVLTIDNTRALLTEWGNDPVNDHGGVAALSTIPPPLVRVHAAGILKHYDDVCGDQYGWHENFCDLWQSGVEAVIAVDPEAVATFVEHTLPPRLEDAATDFAEQCNPGQEPPSLFQEPLLDTAAMLREIAALDPRLLAPSARRLAAALHPHWKALLRTPGYPAAGCGSLEDLRGVLGNLTAPLAITDLGGNEHLLPVGWSAAPGGDLVALAQLEHPATLGAAEQAFKLVTADATAAAATVPVLLSGSTPPSACLVWLDSDKNARSGDKDGTPAPTRGSDEDDGPGAKRARLAHV